MADIQYYGTGRRKNAIARVYVRPGKGEITINRREFTNYFPNEALQMIIRQPLSLTETTGKFDILVNVGGGGIAGQGRCSATWNHESFARIQCRFATGFEKSRFDHARPT